MSGPGRGGRPWRRLRETILAAHPLCARCLPRRHVEAAELHHLVPVADGGTNAPGNLQPLCSECHLAAHGRTRQPYAVRTRRRWW